MQSFCESPVLHDQWYVVAVSRDVADQPIAVRLLGQDFALWRSPEGVLLGAPDRCPHRQAPLSAGTVKDGLLVCRYHGWTFGEGGRCVQIPSAAGLSQMPSQAHLPTVNVVERYGLVWMCPGTPAAEIPEIVEDADPSFRRFNTQIQQWRVSAGRMVDNFMDISHFAFVHDASIGQGVNPDVPRFDVGPLDEWFTGYSYSVEVANPESAQATSGDPEEVTTVQMSTGFRLPFLIRGTMQFRSGVRQVLLLTTAPIDDAVSMFTFALWRNDDADEREVVDFELQIDAEDQRMLELIDGPLPLTPGSLLSVRSDKGSEEWRRQFANLLGVSI